MKKETVLTFEDTMSAEADFTFSISVACDDDLPIEGVIRFPELSPDRFHLIKITCGEHAFKVVLTHEELNDLVYQLSKETI